MDIESIRREETVYPGSDPEPIVELDLFVRATVFDPDLITRGGMFVGNGEAYAITQFTHNTLDNHIGVWGRRIQKNKKLKPHAEYLGSFRLPSFARLF